MTKSALFDKFCQEFATVFGIGKLGPAPGTLATAVTLPFAFVLDLGGIYFYMIATVAIVLLGIVAAERTEHLLGIHDSKTIVIDEVAGFLIAKTWLPATWPAYMGAFLLFRLLDIKKPLFIGTLDKKVPGGLGVMADDIAAGLVANLILQIIYTQTTWLGVQISG